MVTVAQSAELWIVAPAVVGSSPIGHPSPIFLTEVDSEFCSDGFLIRRATATNFTLDFIGLLFQ